MSKIYTKAPLPFMGQKRNFIKHMRTVLDQIPGNGEGWTIVDVFGGSGLLAHTCKRHKPAARVIYNDYDGYAARLAQIPNTNRLRRKLAEIVKGIPKNKRLEPQTKAAIVAAIENFGGKKDLQTVMAWLLFSGTHAATWQELYKKNFYHAVPQSDYPDSDGYLDGLEIRRACFKELLPEFAGKPQTLILLDPPYISTIQGRYAQDHYFGMVDFLSLMDLAAPPFVMFGSSRAEFDAYLDYIKAHRPKEWQKFDGLQKIIANSIAIRGITYRDNMVYKLSADT